MPTHTRKYAQISANARRHAQIRNKIVKYMQIRTDTCGYMQIPANVQSVDFDSLQETIRTHSRSLESASSEREHKKMKCNEHMSAKVAVSMASFLVLAAYAVHRSLAPDMPELSDPEPPGSPSKPVYPPLLPPLEWKQRSNGPACRNLKACSSSDTVNYNTGVRHDLAAAMHAFTLSLCFLSSHCALMPLHIT